MDVGLPDIDGREAVRILRKNGFKAPIIMLGFEPSRSFGDRYGGRATVWRARVADERLRRVLINAQMSGFVD
jgi:hypothetical protein